MEHDTTIQHGIAGRAPLQLANEAILNRQVIVRERLLVVEMPESSAEILVLIIPYLEQPVLNTKRVAVVVTKIVTMELHHPVIDILAVEELNPLPLRSSTVHGATREQTHNTNHRQSVKGWREN